jgi:anthranilate phosphoribosyltransferase
MAEFKTYVQKIATGATLSRGEANDAFDAMLTGGATPAQIGAFLMGLRMRGETVDEISGAVASLRSKVIPVSAPEGAMDIVGTGGDGSGSYNVSTAAAIITAGCGVKVAKHGNRGMSSKSGTADTLAALGVKLDVTPEIIAKCVTEAGIGFMFAQGHHPAMKHVGPYRVEMGTPTVFNLMGPLSNPAGVKKQLLGVFSPKWVVPLAHVLSELGSTDVWVVHGSGMDEITLAGTTQVTQLKDGKVTSFELSPEDAGLQRCQPEALKGGDPAENAAALRKVLSGEASAYSDIAKLNAAAALIVAGHAENLKDGVSQASASIKSGAAQAALDKLVSVSNG